MIDKFSHSSLSTFRRCKVRFKWQYMDNYVSPPGLGQMKGSMGHAALSKWYTTFDEAQAMEAASQVLTGFQSQFNMDLQEDWEFMDLILHRYFVWSDENDNLDEILAVEKKFDIVLGDYTLTGYIDGVVQDKSGIWLMEHKFNQRMDLKGLDLDPQMSIYLLAARKIGYDAVGIIYNGIRMTKGGIAESSPVVRTKIFFNQEGLNVIEYELIAQMKEATDFLLEKGELYRNPTHDCYWDCGFYRACLMLNDSGDARPVLAQMQGGKE
jgi:hypothetical protein